MGRVFMSGVVPMMVAPVPAGVLASSLSVGSSVYLRENGNPAEYLIVHQGLPDPMYDASCDGTWLLRKDIYTTKAWHGATFNGYDNSDIHVYLNSNFISIYNTNTQTAIKTVKIPYVDDTDSGEFVVSGDNGVIAKCFLLSVCEVGYGKTYYQYSPEDGTKLDYFLDGGNDSEEANALRLAFLNGTVRDWWLRSCSTFASHQPFHVQFNGHPSSSSAFTYASGVRPALILPSTALFDPDTLEFKGVA